MKIGILGTRGIPNAYGGFEQFAQFLALGLYARGHEVYVYNSSTHPYQQNQWNNIRLIHCKDWENKIGTAGQFFYDLNCILDARKRKFNILLQLGYTSNSIWRFLWPADTLNVVNMDGLEWKRTKYGKLTRSFLQSAEKWAARGAHYMVSDSTGIQSYLNKKYGLPSDFIPYGADIPEAFDIAYLERYHLPPYRYNMVMARMEPENNIEMVLKAHRAVHGKVLLVVGKTDNKYGQYLKNEYESANIIFVGGIYDIQIVNTLRHYADVYFHGHSVGGTNPSLLEAMACSCNIAAHDNEFNRAVLGADARYFNNSEEIQHLLTNSDSEGAATNKKYNNLQKIATIYNWDKVIEQYESLFKRLIEHKKS
ncbi:DUF1972 domain-containing protein [Parasegetibacter sp. NRK P23]|uniref:DUF1972 domain-containing protein n=1 Tax=Parasegetibacter sp. NRK P23 TaxID=2942999 RepID=UPI002042D3A9|nr:DUF1972 domain-containing protein [Parasegetibacter sp. NRK P23]MCM5527506.1 DUF1972 domain-containing protein [Parasegetibacter sp. NRK P23]